MTLIRGGTPLKKLPMCMFKQLQCLLSVSFPHQWYNTRAVPDAAAAGWMVKILHGQRDKLIPIAMGRELHALAKRSSSNSSLGSSRSVASGNVDDEAPAFFGSPTASHNDIMRVSFTDYAIAMGFSLPQKHSQNGVCARRRRSRPADSEHMTGTSSVSSGEDLRLQRQLSEDEEGHAARALAAADAVIEQEMDRGGLPPLPS